MSNSITVWDKQFSPYITENDIQERVRNIASRINLDYEGKWPIFIAILNGAFMFASDLFKNVAISCEITFVKLASYQGTESTGEVKTLLGFNESVKGRHVIVIEDIVDTGVTLRKILDELEMLEPESIRVAALLQKPDALIEKCSADYIGFKVPNKFLLGYGLDYDGRGRNLKEIYKLDGE
ncbi:MAG: hypoxanthine phosphoribosyltransferase [Limisphaerales bacterium]|jgi:hypoxanthine phosphoribosyltransferase